MKKETPSKISFSLPTLKSLWLRLLCVLSSYGRSWKRRRASWCIFVGYDPRRLRCIDPTTKSVSPHLVFDEASSWWSSENVVLPYSGMLDFRMRAQAPEQQEPDIVSHSGPESKKLHEALLSEKKKPKARDPLTKSDACLEESNKIFKRIPAEGTVFDSRLRRSTRIRKPNQSQVYRSQLCGHCDT